VQGLAHTTGRPGRFLGAHCMRQGSGPKIGIMQCPERSSKDFSRHAQSQN